MELYLFRPDDYQRLYNCSGYQVDAVPLDRRRHLGLGVTFVMMFAVYEFCYIPCLISIWKHRAQACYKFMLFIGVIDVLCLFVCCLLHGYLALEGAVFCSHPDLIYWAGIIGFFFWVLESSVDILLAVNRCIEMMSPLWGQRLYAGHRTWLWLIPPLLYAGYIAVTQMPILFSGIYFSWFFNPHVGYIDDFGSVYFNNWQTFHNWLVFFGLTSAYVVFTVLFFAKMAAAGPGRGTFAQKAIFLQVLAISAVNTFCGLIYIYMQFFRISDWVIYLGSFLWVKAHGLPALIYLVMNKTIRRDVAQMLDPIGANANSNKVCPLIRGPTAAGTTTRLATVARGTTTNLINNNTSSSNGSGSGGDDTPAVAVLPSLH